jgi:hypothetical protein
VNVACSVHQEFKKISLGNQKPQDLVRLGPGVVSDLNGVEVCVVCDVVVFAKVVPVAALREQSQSRARKPYVVGRQQYLSLRRVKLLPPDAKPRL